MESFYKATYLEDFRAHILHIGRVIWQFGGIFKTSCNLDISKYPFDTQSCNIIIENWSYQEDFVNLTQATLNTDHMKANSLWSLQSTNVVRTTFYDTILSYPRYRFKLTFKRKSQYYVLNILMPCAMMLLTALGVFWLPADCGEKISLGITVLLAYSVFQIVIMDNTPVNSETTPFLSECL